MNRFIPVIIGLTVVVVPLRSEDSIVAPITRAAVASFRHDPSIPTVQINALHAESSMYAFSCDNKYLFTCNIHEINIWDRINMRLIKSLQLSGADAIYAHPTDPSRIVVHVNPATYKDKEDTYMTVDWTDGTVVGHSTASRYAGNSHNGTSTYIPAVPELMCAVNSRYNYLPYRKTDRYTGKWYWPKPTGSVRTDATDSLLLLSGPYPMIYDLKRLRLATYLPYYDNLRATDTSLRYPVDTIVMFPKPSTWKIPPQRIYMNRSHYEAYFTDSGTVVMGGANPYITEWDINTGKPIRSIHVPQNGGAVFDFKDYGGKRVIAANGGIFYGPVNGPYRQLSEYTPYSRASRDAMLKMANLISEPYADGLFITSLSSSWKDPAIVGRFSDGRLLSQGLGSAYPGEILDIKISPDGKYALAVDGFRGHVISLKNPKKPVADPPIKTEYEIPEFTNTCAILPDGRFAFGTNFGNVRFYNPSTGEWGTTYRLHNGRVTSMNLSSDNTRLYSSDENGVVVVWDVSTAEPVVTIYFMPPAGYLCVTPDQYYSYHQVRFPLRDIAHISKDNRTYSYDQFDLTRNRPDIVLERLGGDREYIDLLNKAWRRRVKREGLDPEVLTAPDYHVPEVEISNSGDIRTLTDSENITVKVHASDDEVDLARLSIFVNGVHQSDKVLENQAKGCHDIETDFNVELAHGDNEISVVATNRRGARGLAAEVSVRRTAGAGNAGPQRQLWVVAVGVSDYADPHYRLKYAAKDARDIKDLFTTGINTFNKVNTLLLTDGQFTTGSLETAREFLSKAGRDDAVVLFFAGHGVLDSRLDYYLATADMNFSNPSARGVSMEAFTGILDGIRPLKRYVLIDACHSGGIDKEEFIADNTQSVSSVAPGGLRFRSAGGIKERSKTGALLRRISGDMFSELTTEAGATIIASSDGEQVSMEGDKWGNGLFTHLIKEGLSADGANGGLKALVGSASELTFEALGRWVAAEASRISDNRQTPVMRTVTPEPLVIYRNK